MRPREGWAYSLEPGKGWGECDMYPRAGVGQWGHLGSEEVFGKCEMVSMSGIYHMCVGKVCVWLGWTGPGNRGRSREMGGWWLSCPGEQHSGNAGPGEESGSSAGFPFVVCARRVFSALSVPAVRRWDKNILLLALGNERLHWSLNRYCWCCLLYFPDENGSSLDPHHWVVCSEALLGLFFGRIKTR